MAEEKTRRQLNLVICLLATRRYMTAQEIRATVQGYERVESDDAFKRMFERDKDELRRSGIPVETGDVDLWGDERGYRISRADYELPPIELRPDEAGILGLAARAWRHAALGDVAADALLKLRAAGVPVDADAAPSVAPVLDTDEPAFLPIWQALRDRRPVEFDYRAPGREVTRRELEPWRIVNRRGRWYVAGFDRVREDVRVFRLSRIVGEVRPRRRDPAVTVPADADVDSLVRLQYEREPDHVAVLRVRADSAHEIRRRAERIVPGEHRLAVPGWDVVHYPYAGLGELVPLAAGFADRVVIEEPAEARHALAAHLRAVADHESDTTPGDSEDERHPATSSRRSGASQEQLRRLLLLVPYALTRKDVEVSEIAAHFGLSERQVIKDLGLLWMCGLPGYTPGDLIDVDMDAARTTGEIILGNAETLAAPLRLTADEAACLVVGLRLLRELRPVADSDALRRITDKLTQAAGGAVAEFAEAVDVRVELAEETTELRRRADAALRGGQRLHLRYHSYYRDEVSDREVDPMRLVVVDGYPYLEGWCRLKGGVRLFRLDRVMELTVLPVAAAVPGHARQRALDGGALELSAADSYVTLELSPAVRWVTEEYVCSAVRELDNGGLRATLRTPDPAWVGRLALRLGADGRVVAPTDLADRVRAEARRALRCYETAAWGAPDVVTESE